MNNSIQKEIAAPQDCKKNLLLLSITLINLILLAISFIALEVIRRSFLIDSEYVNSSFFISIIVAIAIVTAVLLRKNHLIMLIILTFAAIDSGLLMGYHSIIVSKNSIDLAWRLITLIFSFLVLIFTLLFIGFYYSKPRKRNPLSLGPTRFITYTAMLTALSVICKIIGNSIQGTLPILVLKPTFVYIPWVFAGIILGPIGGFAAAIIGDVIGQLAISTGGAPLPLLSISNGLFAVFPALVYKFIKIKDTKMRALIAVVAGTLISSFVCTLGMSTYVLYDAYFTSSYESFWAYFSTRVMQLGIIGINVVIMILLIPPLIRTKLLKQPVTLFFD